MLKTRSFPAAAATLTATALLLTACGGGSTSDSGSSSGSPKTVTQAEFDKAMSTPTNLTFWTWVPDIDKEIALFEKKYPAIKVKAVNIGSSTDQYKAMRTSLRAGKGAPDVAQVEYQFLSSFTLTKNLLDLSPYHGIKDMKSEFPTWVWNQVSSDGAVYAVPQDTAPMGMIYRNDILAKYGIKTPTTWEEFATAAKTLHEKNPEAYITNLPGSDPGQFVGLLWQNGANPFGFDGKKTVTIDLDSPEVTQVVDYWQKLIQAGEVSTDADFNDQWYKGLSSGKYASWLAAAWGRTFLEGAAKTTSGKWRTTELPQWNAGDHATGNWGGSTNAVMNTTKNPIAAAELARYINVEEEPANLFVTKQQFFPSKTSILNSSEFADAKSDFYGGQQANKTFVDASQNVTTSFGWLPFMDYAYTTFNDTLGKAIADKGDMEAGLKAWQEKLVAYAKQQGLTVK
ncbi:ABC transporter substrate-binding protein [Streptomyces sp. NPDC020951]|uniref:ABC transporter substrate-binding protein n=1 Tax=Streptomyces sp. NPDC020951 TaxID=3365104 RepID=UPI003789518D